jgi:predicted kinase
VTSPQATDPDLPPDQLEEIFQQIIVPDYLLRSNPQPQQHPQAILLGGQPGAGKSTTAPQFHREFTDRGGLVWVTWDDFRPFHPDYQRLLRERPAYMPDITRPAARWWQDRAATYLRAGCYHTLLEGGFRDPATVLATAERFTEAGYHVRICALAVPAALSRLGIIERYAKQVEVAGTGRWTTAASHEADYTGTVQVLRLAEASPAVSRISLFTRDGLVYDNYRDPTGQWTSRTSPLDILTEARDTPLSRLQCTALANRLVDTLDRLKRAGSAHPALYEMAAEVEQALGPITLRVAALDHLHGPAPLLGADIGPTRDLNHPPRESPDPDLSLDI